MAPDEKRKDRGREIEDESGGVGREGLKRRGKRKGKLFEREF